MPGALKFYGAKYSIDELLKIVLQDIDFYNESGGGVTCSGGEPLSSPELLAEFLTACKREGLHTAVDTSGYAPWHCFEKILPFTDIFLYDIKHMNADEHKKLTSINNALILENLLMLSESGANIEIRLLIIPSLNDDDENISQTAGLLKKIKLSAVRLLPYHALAGSKYLSLGKANRLPLVSGDEHLIVKRVGDYLKDELANGISNDWILIIEQK